jgi:hypothetical protein
MAENQGTGGRYEFLPNTVISTEEWLQRNSSIERVDSGSGTISVDSDGFVSRQVEVRWIVHSIDGYTAAEKKGIELAPLYYDGHRRGELSCRPIANGWYEITARYENAGVDSYEGRVIKNTDDVTFIPSSVSLDTTGGTEHIQTAFLHEKMGVPIYRGYARPGQTAPETYGAINVSGGRVNGLDVTVPSFNWTETWLVPAWYLFVGKKPTDEELKKDEQKTPTPNNPYALELRNSTGLVNSDDFRGFKAGEVLFLGASFDSSVTATMVAVTYSFSARQNRENFQVGAIKIIYKGGWDYMWIDFGDEVDNDFPVKFPRYAYVDQVYGTMKFSDLKIGQYWPRFYLGSGNVFTHKLDLDARKPSDARKDAMDKEKQQIA